MSEVIRVPRERARGEQIADSADEPVSESQQTTEVIRVVSRRATSDSVSVEHAKPDPEGQHKEVIRVGASSRQALTDRPMPGDPEPPQGATFTGVAGDSASREANAGKPERELQEVAAVAAVFSDSLKALDLVAAEQARWVLNIAECLAEAVRSPGMADSRGAPGGDSSDQNEVETLVTALKRTADTQMKALTTAQARLAEMAAGGKSDSGVNARSMSPGAPGTSVEVAVANMISNLNLAQQNAVANQQSMNSIAQAAISTGVSLLYSLSAQPAAGAGKE